MPTVQQTQRLKDNYRFWRNVLMHELQKPSGSGRYHVFAVNTITENLATIIAELTNMAGKPTNKDNGNEWKGFVEARLSEEQKDAFNNWDADGADIPDLIAGLIAEGYKFTATYNGKNDTYTASVTGVMEKGPNKGFTLSGFAPDMLTAMKVLLFKHYIVLDGNWSTLPAASKGGIG